MATGTRHASPEEKNFAEIERLEGLLEDLRAAAATTTVREVGAMLINVGWEQSYAADRTDAKRPQP